MMIYRVCDLMNDLLYWIPACAGMTKGEGRRKFSVDFCD